LILQQDFDIDIAQYGASYMVAFGYRMNEQKIKTRRKTDEVITWR